MTFIEWTLLKRETYIFRITPAIYVLNIQIEKLLMLKINIRSLFVGIWNDTPYQSILQKLSCLENFRASFLNSKRALWHFYVSRQPVLEFLWSSAIAISRVYIYSDGAHPFYTYTLNFHPTYIFPSQEILPFSSQRYFQFSNIRHGLRIRIPRRRHKLHLLDAVVASETTTAQNLWLGGNCQE